jgi:hypothetical protein
MMNVQCVDVADFSHGLYKLGTGTAQYTGLAETLLPEGQTELFPFHVEKPRGTVPE